MSNELLQKIKDEYAREYDWKDYPDFCLSLGIIGITVNNNVTRISERYAAAVTAGLQSENEQLKSDMQSVIDNHVVIEKAFEQMKEDIQELRNRLKILSAWDYAIGIDGCTWGDSEFDSLSASEGYNQCLNNVKEVVNELLNKTKHYEQ